MKNVTGDMRYEDAVDAWVVRHTVSFAHDTKGGAVAGGSGVLVRCGNIGGVLTCAHVVEDIVARRPDTSMGIVANGASAGQFQAVKMRIEEFSALPRITKRGGAATEKEEALGPDLGFVRLPESTMAALETIGSPLSLEQQKALRGPRAKPGVNEVLTVAVGYWGELVTAAEHGPSNIVVTFTAVKMTGEAHSEPPHDGYDRFRLKVHPMASYPRSYGGLSGGGVWILGVKSDDAGAVTVLERKLVGIAYYQTGSDASAQRHVLLHGPSSIYDRLLPEIEALAAAARP